MTPHESQEADLLALLRAYAGEIEALAELFDRHTPVLHAVCTAILGDERQADDVLHKTWLLVGSRARLYDRRDGPVANWLLMLARHEAIEIVRARAERAESAALVGGAPATSSPLDDRPEAQAVRRLPSLERQALEGAFYRGMMYPRLAAHLEVDVPTARRLLRRGLESLTALTPAKEPV